MQFKLSSVIYGLILSLLSFNITAFIADIKRLPRRTSSVTYRKIEPADLGNNYGKSLVNQRMKPLNDLLGLGPAEIAITLVVGLVLFGPETLKSLSKDVGRAAAELKEIPKTFKEGMDEGAESSQVAKMKAIAAEKRLKRDAKRAAKEEEEDDDEEEA